MAADAFDPHLEVITYRGFKVAVRKTPLDWIAVISLAGGQPVATAGHDRESAIAMATAWVDEHHPSEKIR